MSENFGSRLRRERERLGFTQKAFAEKVGVSRMTQVNYESGKRYPGEDYFAATQSLGVDGGYLVFGFREADMTNGGLAARCLLWVIEEALELEKNTLVGVLDAAAERVEPAMEEDSLNPLEEYCSQSVAAIFQKSPAIFDASTFAELLGLVEGAIARRKATIPAEKKALLLSMVYRSAKSHGGIDPAMVEDSVSLAIG